MTRAAHRWDPSRRTFLVVATVECPHCAMMQTKHVRRAGRTYRQCRHCGKGYAVAVVDGAFTTEAIQ